MNTLAEVWDVIKYQRQQGTEGPVVGELMDKAEAGYHKTESTAIRCGTCEHFAGGQNRCNLVEGPIRANDVCRLWSPELDHPLRGDTIDQPGDADSSPYKRRYEAQPSETADISPAKAKQMLEEGVMNGQPISEAQRGMLGAIISKGE